MESSAPPSGLSWPLSRRSLTAAAPSSHRACVSVAPPGRPGYARPTAGHRRGSSSHGSTGSRACGDRSPAAGPAWCAAPRHCRGRAGSITARTGQRRSTGPGTGWSHARSGRAWRPCPDRQILSRCGSAGKRCGGRAGSVGAENFIHVTRPGGIRRSCHRREPASGPGTDQDRPVRVAVSAVPRRAASGEAGADCGGSRTRARSAADGSGSR